MLSSNELPGGEAHGLFEGVRDTVRFSPSRPARLCWSWCRRLQQQPPRHEADALYPACPSWCRDLVVTACAAYSAGKVPQSHSLLLLLLARTPLHGVTTPVGSMVARRVTTLSREILLLRIAVPRFAVVGTGAVNVPLFWATLPFLHPTVMPSLTKVPLLVLVSDRHMVF